MKKTLITLVALSGLTMASTVDELNTALAQDLASFSYAQGAPYELTFTLALTDNSTNGPILKLADNAYLITQVGRFAGIHTDSNNGITSWADAVTPDTTSVEGRTITTVTTTQAANSMWFTFKQDGSSHNEKMLNNTTITLSYDGTDTVLSIDYAGAQYNQDLINRFVWEGISFNANDIRFMSANIDSTYGSCTPEPATATLSLLALAGLCARRKRH